MGVYLQKQFKFRKKEKKEEIARVKGSENGAKGNIKIRNTGVRQPNKGTTMEFE